VLAVPAGAVGDGVTDDTEAFEKAAAADFTGVLNIPAGTFV
jgi:polygalacturonase